MPGAQLAGRSGGAAPRSLRRRSDERLVRIARDGDERAFELLFERHGQAILRYCRSLLPPQEAEDVCQEVFVLAISALRRGAEPRSFRPWLYRIAHNACVSHLRVRRPVLVGDDGMLAGPGVAVEPGDVHREELRELLNDIRLLPEVQRGALLLREMDGFSYEQVGEVLGVPQSTVRASIFRARRTLQGLAEARDADCQAIQSELCELADRRGRRNRRITAHLRVCPSCRSFRDALRRRPSILGVTPLGAGFGPLSPIGAILALKTKLFGGASAGGAGAAAAASAGGGAGMGKVAALASTCALLAGGSLEAERALDAVRQDRRVAQPDAGGTPRDRPGRTRQADSFVAPAVARAPAVASAPAASAPATSFARSPAATLAPHASANTVASPGAAPVARRRPAPDASDERPARRRPAAVPAPPAGAPGPQVADSPASHDRSDGVDAGHHGARAEGTVVASRTHAPDHDRGDDAGELYHDKRAKTPGPGDGARPEKTTPPPPSGNGRAAQWEPPDQGGGSSPADAQGPAPAPTSASPGSKDPEEHDESEPAPTDSSEPPAVPAPDDAGMGTQQP